MPVQVILPTLGEAVSEATLVRWNKKVGDPVKRGDELAMLETAKAAMPLECPENGIVLSIRVQEGTTVTSGEVLAVIGQPGEEEILPSEPRPAGGASGRPAVPAAAAPSGPPGATSRRVSPSARRLAEERGIDLDQVVSLAPGERITTEDVQRFLQAREAANSPAGPALFHRHELSPLRKAVADQMTASAREIPHFSVTREVDARPLMAFKEQARQAAGKSGVKVSLTALLVHLTAQALTKHPLLNARLERGELHVFETVNMSVAVSTPQGLLSPVLFGVEKLPLLEIARGLEDLVARARQGRLDLKEITAGTFTLSNLGMFGVSQFTPLINSPQVAILAAGAARPSSVAQPSGGTIEAPAITLTVVADHRVLDGQEVALFLATLAEAIEVGEVRL
ncbi:MAG: dihydrolipoamide acetyltransferase family protein [Anaerolineales bacterium]|jgi:pyruvate dehydrogenase E2 component (dihydrolipoamide acetyltransferase)